MRRLLLIKWIGFCSAIFSSWSCADAKVLHIGADPWCPYNCEADARQKGYLVDLAVAVFKKRGYEVVYENLPWARALLMVEKGNLDAAVGVVQGNKGALVLNQVSLGKDQTVFIVRKGFRFTYSGPGSLDNKQMGVIANYTYDNNGDLDQYITLRINTKPATINVLHHKNALDSLFTMLLKKRIDIFPENQYVAANKAQQLGKLQSIDIVPSGASDDVHFGFRDNPTGRELAVQFDEGVRELKSTGKFDQILNTYGLR